MLGMSLGFCDSFSVMGMRVIRESIWITLNLEPTPHVTTDERISCITV